MLCLQHICVNLYFWCQQRYVLLMVHSEQYRLVDVQQQYYTICSSTVVVHSVSHIATDSHYTKLLLYSASSYPIVQSQIETLVQQMHVGEGEVVSRQLAPAQRAALCRHHCSTDCISSPMAAPQRHTTAAAAQHTSAMAAAAFSSIGIGEHSCTPRRPAHSPTGGTRGGELSIRVAAPRTRAAFNYTFSVFSGVSYFFYRVATQC